MKTVEMEDFLVSLFDPLLTAGEKVDQLKLNEVKEARTFDEAGILIENGVVVTFVDGSQFKLVIIPLHGRSYD